jgi:uroporphyrinogen decarboxylase
MYQHRDADRVPVIEHCWQSTIERWHREGMPKDVPFTEFFGLDTIRCIGIDNSPRFEWKLVEETDDYAIVSSNWGVTARNWKHAASTPEYLDFTVKDRESWAKVKERIAPTRDRINWEQLRKDYAEWRRRGDWVCAELWFGFDATHARVLGTERTLVALLDDPEWIRDIYACELDTSLALLDMVWAEGYHFDELRWLDDMGFKGRTFFSLDVYRDLSKPFHKRAIEWAHAPGVKTRLHSCGNINLFVPELLEIGLDALNPMEVKAGMDPLQMKRDYGDKLVLHGGINSLHWSHLDQMEAEMRRVIPVLKQNGGYIFSSDHSVPSDVSLEGFRQVVEWAHKYGAYE